MSDGAVSVAYTTSDGTATSGTDYTATSGTLNWADGDEEPKTFTVAVSDATPFSGARTFSVMLSDAAGGASITTPSTATVTMTGSDTSTAWVYYNGVFNWGGDYSFEATPNYQDTAGIPEEGPYDLAVTITGAYGGYQPYAGGTVPMWNFDDDGYNYLIMDLKPTVANQVWYCQFHSVGDVAIGSPIEINNYGPAPQVGVWATYKIPLSDLGVLNTSIYKFFIQDDTGLSNNLFYIDNLGFSIN